MLVLDTSSTNFVQIVFTMVIMLQLLFYIFISCQHHVLSGIVTSLCMCPMCCLSVMQYTYLLTSQLESQRLYFEEKMENVERQSQRQVTITQI